MANAADNVTFNPKPILVGAAWALVATHSLSGQQEQVIGFHSETEAKEWLASKGCKAWLKTRGYANWTTTFATPPTPQPPT
jgi:hypothetical protein